MFQRGQEWADKMGLILVDTKYEFGMLDGKLIVIDEIHTPDSSRYWIKDEYENRFRNEQDQKMLDKENIRQWLPPVCGRASAAPNLASPRFDLPKWGGPGWGGMCMSITA